MRNHSSARSFLRRALMLCVAGAAVHAFCTFDLHAQCSPDDDTESYGCQTQQAVPSTTQSSASPTVLTMQEAPQLGSPRPDRSSSASASRSLSSGDSYTEQSSHNGASLRHRVISSTEPPTEFQRFVAASTGRMLPIYGARLFAELPVSFGPLDQAAAPQDMLIGAGDELRIRIWGQINFSANLRVSREGDIYLPKAGAVHVAGLAYSAVAGHLRTALERVYRNFELSVDMGEIHSIQVYVTGQARQPGEYTVSALSTLVNALFLSGGPSGAGSMRHVELKRQGKVLTDFDLYALLVKGDKTGDVQLHAGDVLFIPSAGPQVALLGSVRLAAIYELRGQVSIEELLNSSGGETAIASNGRISVERVEDHARRRAFELNADAAGLATLLADGDIVRIDPIVSSYREAVTLRGSLANPGRFLWHQGMRLSELLPDRDSLVTRDYWWQRTQLGLPAPELAAPASNGAQKEELPDKPDAVTSPGAQTDWNFAVIERLNPNTMTTSLLPFNLGKLILNHDASQDLELRPGDVITVFSQADIHPPIDEQTKYVRLEGEFAHAGIYSVTPGETLRSLVMRSGGLTAKAYLYGAAFRRKSAQALEQKSFNEYIDRLEHDLARSSVSAASSSNSSSQVETQAGRIMSVNQGLIARLRQSQPTGRIVLNLHPQSTGENELPDIPVEDGDVLTVPSVPATVQVIGAVLNQNAFLYRGGRASNYLHLAGGPNRDADRKQTFILRADGSVTGRLTGQSIFSYRFENVRLYPGDSVIVPEKHIKPGSLSAFMAWSQMFSQYALGAAAVNVLK